MEGTNIETKSTIETGVVEGVLPSEFSTEVENEIPVGENASVVEDISKEKTDIFESKDLEEVYPISTGYALEAEENISKEAVSGDLARNIQKEKAKNLPIAE